MKSAANGFLPRFTHLSLIVLLPAVALAARAQSSMEVSVQVVRGDYSTATAALIEKAEIRDSVTPAIAECKAIGSTVTVDGIWATCSWDSDGHGYLVTVRY